VAKFFYPTKLLEYNTIQYNKLLLTLLRSSIKRLLSDGFNVAAIKSSLMKSHNTQTLSFSY